VVSVKEIIISDDQRYSELSINQFKNKYQNYELFDLTFDESSTLYDALSNGNLFSTNRDIVCYSLNELNSKEYMTFSEKLNAFTGNFIGLLSSEKKPLTSKLNVGISVNTRMEPSEKDYLRALISFSSLIDFPIQKEALLQAINSKLFTYHDLQNIILIASLSNTTLTKYEEYMALSTEQVSQIPPWEEAANIEKNRNVSTTVTKDMGEAIGTISYLSKRYLDMLTVLEGNLTEQSAPSYFPGMNPYALSILLKDARSFNAIQLEKALTLLSEFDILLKSNPKDDVFTLLSISLRSIFLSKV